MEEPRCACCGKYASELREFKYTYEESGLTPSEFVRIYEGTYSKDTNKFYCTKCYINLGCPLGKAK